jgi:putative transposase
MISHIHLVIGTNKNPLQDILRDFKSHTSRKLKKAIKENPKESRREWMIWMMESAGKNNSNNVDFQFWQQRRRVALIFLKGLLGNK